MYKKLKDLRKSKKGFTLVELIVVLVILAILAAILIPALLGYIDKAREKQITTDANAALTAAQSTLDEEYGLNKAPAVTKTNITDLTQITANWTAAGYSVKGGTATDTSNKDNYQITGFYFTENSKTVTWDSSTGAWSVVASAPTTGYTGIS